VVAQLRPGELAAAADACRHTADPRNAATDHLWWNWCRMPPGLSGDRRGASTVAVLPAVAEHLAQWLHRDLDVQPANRSARAALASALAAATA